MCGENSATHMVPKNAKDDNNGKSIQSNEAPTKASVELTLWPSLFAHKCLAKASEISVKIGRTFVYPFMAYKLKCERDAAVSGEKRHKLIANSRPSGKITAYLFILFVGAHPFGLPPACLQQRLRAVGVNGRWVDWFLVVPRLPAEGILKLKAKRPNGKIKSDIGTQLSDIKNWLSAFVCSCWGIFFSSGKGEFIKCCKLRIESWVVEIVKLQIRHKGHFEKEPLEFVQLRYGTRDTLQTYFMTIIGGGGG